MTISRHNPDSHVEELPEADLLISRLVDFEASAEDEAHFHEMAATEPSLWRRLALQQRDARQLADQVERVTWRASQREIPRRWLIPTRFTWTMALSGWAAVLIITLSWALATIVTTPRSPAPVQRAEYALTPEQHYEQYRQAPYVLGEWQPLVLEVEPLSDGRVAVYFIRRVEEVAFLNPEDLPLDENGELTKDLRKLRQAEPKVRIF